MPAPADSGNARDAYPGTLKVSTTAPGKVVLLGEYAVLEGAPAVAIAADRAARVDLAPVRGNACRVSAAPDPSVSRHFVLGAGGELRWQDGSGRADGFELLQAVVEQAPQPLGLSMLARYPFSVRLDSSSLFHAVGQGKPSKLGLGSSAALTVALALALREFSGLPGLTRKHWLPLLVAVHRAFQGGRGSGVDIAASLYGGSIVYQIGGDGPAAREVVLPPGLHYRFIWTGQSASTPGLLGQLAAWRDKNSRYYNGLMGRMGEVSTVAVAAADEGDSERFRDAVEAYARCLEDLGKEADIDIYSLPHRRLAALALESRLVYKPCGAGGGDLGIVLGAHVEGVDRFIAQAEDSGFPPIDISIDPEGVRTIRSS